ncbi:hypothetical protein NDA18_005456 [Ustilago nuda]|nr:hypothetical protein NDA18_005456 [Ustilago nuda]
MAFQRAMLLSALLGSAYMTEAAPVSSSSFSSFCQPNLKQWGQITFKGKPLSIENSGNIVVGGNPLNFAVATCSTQNSGPKGLMESSKGYFVNANDPSQCMTVSNLVQSKATFSFSDCRFNGAGNIWSSQSFVWTFDNNGAEQTGSVWFNGENFNNNTSIYTLHTRDGQPTIDGQLGDLIAEYTPNLNAIPSDLLQIPMQELPVTAPARDPSLSCQAPIRGQIIFNNQTSSSNGYEGPVNSKWEAESDTSAKFLFEECDYSFVGLQAEGDYMYGRIRPATDVVDGGYNCYFLTADTSSGPNNEPVDNSWINGFQVQTCSYTAHPGLDLVKINRKDNTFNYVPFGNGSQPGNMYWYAQAAYDTDYGVKQYQFDPKGVGQVYLSPNNANLTKFPAAKVMFKAD